MNEINEIGSRLRELREASDYTVERLSAELKVDPEVYRGYEQDGKDIPISLIYEVANKFGVDFAEILTGTPARLDTYHIVRRGHGRVVNRNPEYHFEDLAYRYADKVMQPLLVTLEPSDKPAGLITHSGQEFNLVLDWGQGVYPDSGGLHLLQPHHSPRPALRRGRKGPVCHRHRRVTGAVPAPSSRERRLKAPELAERR